MLHAVNANGDGLSIFKSTRAPTSVKDFNRFYLKDKNSISKNPPMPLPNKTMDGDHVCVSLVDVIANMLASAASVYPFVEHSCRIFYKRDTNPDDVTADASMTKNACKLHVELNNHGNDELTLFLWIKEWSDGFDP